MLAGLSEHRLRQGDPWAGVKPARLTDQVTRKEFEERLAAHNSSMPAGAVQKPKGKAPRARGRDKHKGKPNWEVLAAKRSKLCVLYNNNLCPKGAEACDKEHKCSKQVGANKLCFQPHSDLEHPN